MFDWGLNSKVLQVHLRDFLKFVGKHKDKLEPIHGFDKVSKYWGFTEKVLLSDMDILIFNTHLKKGLIRCEVIISIRYEAEIDLI